MKPTTAYAREPAFFPRLFLAFLSALALTVLWPGTPANAQDRANIHVIASAFPPYSYEGDGRAEGLTVQTVRTLFNDIGMNPTIEVFPWARAYNTVLQEPGTLLFSVARSPEREELLTWVAPVMNYDVRVYRKADRTDITDNALKDLKAYNFAGLIKDIKTTYLKDRGLYVYEVPSEEIAIAMLDAGRVDLFASDKSAMEYRVRQLGLDMNDFKVVTTILPLNKPLYLVANPEIDPLLVKQLRQASLERATNNAQTDDKTAK